MEWFLRAWDVPYQGLVSWAGGQQSLPARLSTWWGNQVDGGKGAGLSPCSSPYKAMGLGVRYAWVQGGHSSRAGR